MKVHPDELLAEYVDGTLGPEGRARAEAHLDACSRCREEVTDARHARAALVALPEVDEPPGLTFPAMKEARRAGRPRISRTQRALAAVAAAAVVIGGVSYLAVSVGTGGDEAEEAVEAPAAEPEFEAEADAETAEEAGQAQAEPDAELALPRFRRSATDYDPDSIQDLARDLLGEAEAGLAQGFPATATAFYEGFDVATLDPAGAEAIRCVTEALDPARTLVPILIERARFEGDPAYVTAFLQGPEPDLPYERLQVIVVEVDTCALLHFARAQL